MQPSLSWSVFFLGLALLSFFLRKPPPSPIKMAEEMPKSIYDITVKDINGNDVNLSIYNGKVLLIVNVASKWFWGLSGSKDWVHVGKNVLE